MAKKKPTTHHNIAKQSQSESGADKRLRDLTLKEIQEYKYSLDLLCNKMREHGFDPEAKDMSSFVYKNKLSERKLQKWRLAVPEIEEAHKDMVEAIHINRRTLWAERRLSESCFLRYARRYDPSEKEDDDYQKQLKQIEDAQRALTVLMQQIPLSDRVPACVDEHRK